jgi:hypothetical protein
LTPIAGAKLGNLSDLCFRGIQIGVMPAKAGIHISGIMAQTPQAGARDERHGFGTAV